MSSVFNDTGKYNPDVEEISSPPDKVHRRTPTGSALILVGPVVKKQESSKMVQTPFISGARVGY